MTPWQQAVRQAPDTVSVEARAAGLFVCALYCGAHVCCVVGLGRVPAPGTYFAVLVPHRRVTCLFKPCMSLAGSNFLFVVVM